MRKSMQLLKLAKIKKKKKFKKIANVAIQHSQDRSTFQRNRLPGQFIAKMNGQQPQCDPSDSVNLLNAY